MEGGSVEPGVVIPAYHGHPGLSVATRVELTVTPRGLLQRYVFDIVEVYLSLFAIIAAFVEPNQTLYTIDFFVSMASLVAYAARVFWSPRPLAYILYTSWELLGITPLAVADTHPALALAVRATRAARTFVMLVYGSDLARLLRSFVRSLALSPIFLLFALTVFMGSLTYYAVEYGKSVRSYFDAVWFTFVTISTVGYGDIVPVTDAGKAVTIVLMVTGIVLWSVMIATFTSAAARTVGRTIARELQRLERKRWRRLSALLAHTYTETSIYPSLEATEAITACTMAVLSLPPEEFEKFIEELRRRYYEVHGATGV